MSETINDILAKINESTEGSFEFKIIKDGRKFLIKIVIVNDTNNGTNENINFKIMAAYDGNICPNIYCDVNDLKNQIENIDKNFKIRSVVKIERSIYESCKICGCLDKSSYGTEFNVSDINKPWSHENRLVTSYYLSS